MIELSTLFICSWVQIAFQRRILFISSAYLLHIPDVDTHPPGIVFNIWWISRVARSPVKAWSNGDLINDYYHVSSNRRKGWKLQGTEYEPSWTSFYWAIVIQTPHVTISNVPPHTQVRDWSTNTVSLSWASGPQSNSVLYYNIEYQRQNDVAGVVPVDRKIFAKQATVENLLPDTNYQFHVIAGHWHTEPQIHPV